MFILSPIPSHLLAMTRAIRPVGITSFGSVMSSLLMTFRTSVDFPGGCRIIAKQPEAI